MVAIAVFRKATASFKASACCKVLEIERNATKSLYSKCSQQTVS